MNLFNIGVDGQYQLAAFSRPRRRRALSLPGPLRCCSSSLVAMVVGALWAGSPALLKGPAGSAR